MATPKPKLAVYHGIALALSGIACIVSAVYAFTLVQNHSSGYGALGEFLVLVFILIVTGILLLHSIIVSILYCIKNSPKSYWGIVINSLMIFLLLSPLLYTGMSHLFATYETRSSFEFRFDNACAEESPQRVLEMINEIHVDIKEKDQYQHHLNNCIETAVRNHRIDLLNYLEDRQIFVIKKDAENYWRRLIDIVASTQNIKAQDLELLEWLTARGKEFNYRLEPGMRFFSHYNICYTNLESPLAQKFAERLMEMGADVNGDPNSYAAWYCARFNRIDALRFLGQHQIALKNNPDYNSILGEAIANYNPQIVALLINLGAKPLYINYEKNKIDCIKYSDGDMQDYCKQIHDYDDLVTACTLNDDGKIKEKQQIIDLLQQAGFRFEKTPDYQAREIYHPETLKCLKEFEKN